MSPPAGTEQTPGSSREQSHQQRVEDESRMQIDLEDKAFAASAQTLPTSGSLSLSSDMGVALDEIEYGAPSSTRRVNTGWRRPAGFDPVAELQRMIEKIEARSRSC